jgi:thiol-disulfide isomerase/thioredoxin
MNALSLSRRQLLALSTILASGAGLAGCRRAAGVDAAKLDAFWALRLPAVGTRAGADGDEVVLAAFRGHPLLVNFWATWCPPCVAELPLLGRFYAERGAHDWQCVGLAVEDKREPVERFLARMPLAYPVALAGTAGIQLIHELGNDQGGLPFSVLFDANGRIKYSKIGQLNFSDLKTWLG